MKKLLVLLLGLALVFTFAACGATEEAPEEEVPVEEAQEPVTIMLAAITVEREGLDAVIPETLDAARHLYVQELDDGSICEELQVSGEADIAQTVISRGCRALICGQISPDIRERLREKDILCFDGYLYQARQVRRLLYTGVLPGIR